MHLPEEGRGVIIKPSLSSPPNIQPIGAKPESVCIPMIEYVINDVNALENAALPCFPT